MVQPSCEETGILLFWIWCSSDDDIFLSSMCPLLPGQVICHSDLSTFSSSFCFCKVNWQTAFPLYRSFCLLLAAHLLTAYLWLYCIWLQAYSLLLIYGFTVARLQFKLHVTNYCLLLSGTSRKRVRLSQLMLSKWGRAVGPCRPVCCQPAQEFAVLMTDACLWFNFPEHRELLVGQSKLQLFFSAHGFELCSILSN